MDIHPQPKGRNFYTIQEVASLLNVSTKTVREWIYEGELPALRYGPRLIRIRPEDLDEFAKPALETW